MPWWLWVVLGVIIYAALVTFALAICRAAGKEDERRGYK